VLGLRCKPSNSAERGYFYLQASFSGVVDDVFELPRDPVVNPVRSALAANRSRHFPDYDNTELQIGGERRRPGSLRSGTERT